MSRTLSPKTSICPALGLSKPTIARSNTDLPVPDPPTTPSSPRNQIAFGAAVAADTPAPAVALAAAVKRRSVFRDRPQQPERDLVVAAVKTVLLIFGSALLATVMIHATRAGWTGQ